MVTNKMHPDEIAIDRELVKRMVEEQFPEWAELSIEPVSSAGTDNAIYRLGTDLAIRLPRIASAAPHIDKEFEWLPRLAACVSLKIPVPIAKGQPSAHYPFPWLICNWLDGRAATQANIDLNKAAVTLGHFIVELQKADTTNAPLSERGRSLLLLNDEVNEALDLLEGIIDVAAAARAWKKALATPIWNRAPVWIHTDLHGGNILVNEGEITAVIDFGMAGIGDPACDILIAWTLLTAQTRDIFRSIVAVDDATWQRGKGYALSCGLIALPYYKNTNPVLANSALRTINEVLGDK